MRLFNAICNKQLEADMITNPQTRAERPTCDACINYHEREPGSGRGECRADPPVVIPGPSETTRSAWPSVSCHMHCGRLKQRVGSCK